MEVADFFYGLALCGRSARRGLSVVLRADSGLAFLPDHELLRWKLLISSLDWPRAEGGGKRLVAD